MRSSIISSIWFCGVVVLVIGVDTVVARNGLRRSLASRGLLQDDCMALVPMDFPALKLACNSEDTVMCGGCMAAITKELVMKTSNEDLQTVFPSFYDMASKTWNRAALQQCATPYVGEFMANEVFGNIMEAMGLMRCTDAEFAEAIEPPMCNHDPPLGTWFTDEIDCSVWPVWPSAMPAEGEAAMPAEGEAAMPAEGEVAIPATGP